MITSGHYLHPEYLQPLPTTLDAKQSPLALLAQTCNSIGKDTNSKSIIPPLEKKDSQKDKDSVKGSPAPKTEDRASGRVSADKRETSSTPKQRESDEKRSSSSQHSPSPADTGTQGSAQNKSHSSPGSPTKPGAGSTRSGSSPVTKPSTPSLSLQSSSKISLNCGSVSAEAKNQESVSAASVSKSSPQTSLSVQPTYADAIAHGTPLHALPGSYHGLSLLGHMGHGAVDAASAAAAYYASLPPAHGGYGLTAPGQKGAAGLPPYLQYTSVKTASGTTLVPVCKDPYCNQCQASVRSTHLGASCSPGCTQCSSEKSLNLTPSTSLHAPTPLGAGLPGLSATATTPQSLLSSLYPHHTFSVLPGQHSMPYVCNWLQGSDYCGKRFGTSEELLLHLRSHTSIADSASLPSALPYPNLGLTTAAAAAAAAAGLPFHYPTQGSLSPNSLRHVYPRSLSPNGLSALVASRYHPYKTPLSSLTPSQHASLPAGLPSHLSPYYLPYSLYGQRLGAAMTP